MRAFLIAMLLFATVPARAETPAEIVSWIGTRDRVFLEGKPVDIPVNLSAVVVPVPSPSVVQVTSGGRELNGSGVTPTIVTRNGQSYLHLELNTETFARAGTYAIQLRIPAPTGFKESIRDVSITRPAAELSVQQPLRIEHVVNLVWPDVWSPVVWPLKESTSEQTVTPKPQTWTAMFAGPDLKPIASKMEFLLPDSIPAGTQRDVTVKEHSNWFPLGTSTGKLVIAAPQLAKPFEQSIEVVSRISLLWLLVTIVVTIVLGHYTRNVLEQRRIRSEALAAAGDLLNELKQLSNTTSDASFRRRYDEAARALKTEVRKDRPDLEAAIAKAKYDIATIGKALTEAEAVATDKIAKVRATIGNPAAQVGPLREEAESVVARLAAIEKNLLGGQITRVTTGVGEVESALPTDVQKAREAWGEYIRKLVTRVGKWPEVPGNDALTAGESAAASVPRVIAITEVAAAMTAAAGVAIDVRTAIRRVAAGARDIAANVALQLEPFRGEASIAPKLDALSASLTSLDVCNQDDLESLAGRIGDLRVALAAALESGIQPGTESPPSLAQGNFVTGLTEILAKRKGDQSLGDPAPLLDSIKQAQTSVTTPAVPSRPVGVHIASKEVAEVGESCSMSLVLTDDVGAATVSSQWYLGDQLAKTADAGDLEFAFTPSSTDPVTVRVMLKSGDRSGSAVMRIAALPASSIDPAEMKKRAKHDQWKQTAVSCLFVVPIGWLIFSKGFIGRPEDFLAAALWGFSADITLPKVLALAAPLTGKTITWP